jgi:hypothetical protein
MSGWTATVTNTSTDDHGVPSVAVSWGDGTAPTTSAPFTHTYARTGTFTITLTATDSIGQRGTATASVTTSYGSITGTVSKSVAAGGGPLGGATITVKQGTTIVTIVVSNATTGVYNIPNLKPGTYNLYVSKTGYTFTTPIPVTVGVGATSQNISALTP